MILGVNLDHVATLRQVRGGSYPNLIKHMKDVIKAGADQITVHLREDLRHIQVDDVFEIKKHCKVLFNLEMACTVKMLKIASQVRPDWVCLVPEKRMELTTEGGLDVYKNKVSIKKFVKKLKDNKIKVSLFVDPFLKQIVASHFCAVDSVELHTGKFALAGSNKKAEFKRLQLCAKKAKQLGLLVAAGHGLDFDHAKKIARLNYLKEVNIGHFLICDSLNDGLGASVKKMKKILNIYAKNC